VTVLVGDCVEVMAGMDAASVDAIVTDPPYGLGFMGKAWDGLPPGREWAAECLRLLKPGGHLLAFGGTRTYHRLACAIEDAGFEIRDTIAWLYGSGFPKSHNIGDGRGTALKPAHEPIVVARKPLTGTVAANVLAHGTGALNIDGCRIAHARAEDLAESQAKNPGRADTVTSDVSGAGRPQQVVNVEGRWPANVALDAEAAAMLDEQSGQSSERARVLNRNGDRQMEGWGLRAESKGTAHGDSGGASRFFYVAKASRAERNAGLDGFEELAQPSTYGDIGPVDGNPRKVATGHVQHVRNHHPTVKPLSLMRWLVRLVTPPGGLVLDPFTGSGTTGIACALENLGFVGIEREPEYAAIAEARIAHWAGQPQQLTVAV
jgi:DNA modification methylase